MLKRRAALEDVYGGSGVDSYLALLPALLEQNAAQIEVVDTCRRGLLVSLREERLDAAKTFADNWPLQATGAASISSRPAQSPRSNVSKFPAGRMLFSFCCSVMRMAKQILPKSSHGSRFSGRNESQFGRS